MAFEEGAGSTRCSTLAAIATGVFVAAYTLTGRGRRAAVGHAQSYTAWLFMVQGAAMPVVYVVLRGRLRFTAKGGGNLEGAGRRRFFGLCSIGGGHLGADARAPRPGLGAARDYSILFAVVIGVVFLKEKVTLSPVTAAALMIAGGAIALSTAH